MLQRRFGLTLMRAGVTQKQPGLLDLAFRLYNPGRSAIALVVATLAVLAGAFPDFGLWPWWLLGAIAAIVVLLPVVFLIVERVPARYIVRYPYVALIAMLWFPIRIASRILPTWKRTTHTG